MKIERILLATAFLAMVGCTAMTTQAPAPAPVDEGVWEKSLGVLPVPIEIADKDGKKKIHWQYAPLEFNKTTRLFRLYIEPEKPVEAPAGEKAE